MSDQTEKLNKVYEQHKYDCKGMLHNALWQIMVNESLKRTPAAFVLFEPDRDVAIALDDGGYIPANFSIVAKDPELILKSLNEQVFGLSPDDANKIISMSLVNDIPSMTLMGFEKY